MQIDGAEIASVCSHSWLSPDKQLSTTPQSAPSTPKQRHFVHTEWTPRWSTASAPLQWTLSLRNLLMRQRKTGVLLFCALFHYNCCGRRFCTLSSVFCFPNYLYYLQLLSNSWYIMTFIKLSGLLQLLLHRNSNQQCSLTPDPKFTLHPSTSAHFPNWWYFSTSSFHTTVSPSEIPRSSWCNYGIGLDYTLGVLVNWCPFHGRMVCHYILCFGSQNVWLLKGYVTAMVLLFQEQICIVLLESEGYTV